MLHWIRCPHPEIGSVREKAWWDQSPTADELVINEADVDLAKGLAVVEQVELPTGHSIECRDQFRDRITMSRFNDDIHFAVSPISISGMTPRMLAGYRRICWMRYCPGTSQRGSMYPP